MLKKHLFKKRHFCKKISNIGPKLKFGTSGLYTTIKQKFEFVYIRVIKKFFRRRYIKGRVPFFKPQFWMCIGINYILSAKSKNARMGAGVGVWVRSAFLVPIFFFLLEFKYYSALYIRQVNIFLNFKTKLRLGLKY